MRFWASARVTGGSSTLEKVVEVRSAAGQGARTSLPEGSERARGHATARPWARRERLQVIHEMGGWRLAGASSERLELAASVVTVLGVRVAVRPVRGMVHERGTSTDDDQRRAAI